MIFELALAVVALGGTASIALIARSIREARRAATQSDLAAALAGTRKGPRGLLRGDVLMVPGEELALGGSLELDEGGFVLRALRVVGGRTDRWIVQLDPEAREIVLASDTAELGEGRVPDEVALGGRTLVLSKRGVARVTVIGDDVPAVEGARVPYVLLTERGGRVAIAIDPPSAERIAIVGERLDRRVVDLLPGGDVPR